MNIFVLAKDPELAAFWHCDQHVRSQIKESAQMIATTIRILRPDSAERIEKAGVQLYKSTHVNHPCTKWVRASWRNFMWLTYLAEHLDVQFSCRTKTPGYPSHKSWRLIAEWLKYTPVLSTDFPTIEQTPFALAMPDEFKKYPTEVLAYRAYYNTKTFAKWFLPSGQPIWYGKKPLITAMSAFV